MKKSSEERTTDNDGNIITHLTNSLKKVHTKNIKPLQIPTSNITKANGSLPANYIPLYLIDNKISPENHLQVNGKLQEHSTSCDSCIIVETESVFNI
jgi:hypothetical protein